MRDTARFFKVLADETRLGMLWLLFNQSELCVCDIMAVLGTTQSKTSRHLSTLRHANLVSDRREGLWSYYTLRLAQDGMAREHLELLRAELAGRPDAASMLAKLHERLEAKRRGDFCSPPSQIAPGGSRSDELAR